MYAFPLYKQSQYVPSPNVPFPLKQTHKWAVKILTQPRINWYALLCFWRGDVRGSGCGAAHWKGCFMDRYPFKYWSQLSVKLLPLYRNVGSTFPSAYELFLSIFELNRNANTLKVLWFNLHKKVTQCQVVPNASPHFTRWNPQSHRATCCCSTPFCGSISMRWLNFIIFTHNWARNEKRRGVLRGGRR